MFPNQIFCTQIKSTHAIHSWFKSNKIMIWICPSLMLSISNRCPVEECLKPTVLAQNSVTARAFHDWLGQSDSCAEFDQAHSSVVICCTSIDFAAQANRWTERLLELCFRQIFGYRRSESVKDVICCLGRVYFRYLLLLRSVKFYKHLYLKSDLLHDIFWSFMIFNCDDCMRTVLSHCIKLLVVPVPRLCVG